MKTLLALTALTALFWLPASAATKPTKDERALSLLKWWCNGNQNQSCEGYVLGVMWARQHDHPDCARPDWRIIAAKLQNAKNTPPHEAVINAWVTTCR